MCFCHRRLCREWITWNANGYKKEWCDLNELWICCSTHQKLLNARLMYRSGQVFIEERAGGRLGRWERLRRFLYIWRCQNQLDGPKDRGNIVERSVNRVQTLGTLIFQGLVRFQLDFRFRSLLPALNGQKLKEFSSKGWSYDFEVLIEVGDNDVSVGGCILGLTMVTLVVVEIWGEAFPPSVICGIF